MEDTYKDEALKGLNIMNKNIADFMADDISDNVKLGTKFSLLRFQYDSDRSDIISYLTTVSMIIRGTYIDAHGKLNSRSSGKVLHYITDQMNDALNRSKKCVVNIKHTIKNNYPKSKQKRIIKELRRNNKVYSFSYQLMKNVSVIIKLANDFAKIGNDVFNRILTINNSSILSIEDNLMK